ncbi:NAD-binding protein [Calocera viscosa TUFC12733]|uniref:NAD-binding protein n=1 Tax=Calocera viscosa (strain TUFC12733) TaxID=1330018 RepID=A0A167MIV5_CALVF|nr:NAD-binding protein [Calocera viscosa TUFC12733]
MASSRSSSRYRSRSRGPSPIRTRHSYLGESEDAVDPDTAAQTNHAFSEGRVAVITGAGSPNGIGFAAAKELASYGMKLVLVDINKDELAEAVKQIEEKVGKGNVIGVPTDVSNIEECKALFDKVYDTFGEVSVLMNNAGIGPFGGAYTNLDNWHKVLDTNLYGVVNMVHTFTGAMKSQENPAVIINTGSKQGITNPPGNAAYNVSKAGVKVLTENLAWEFRQQNAKVTAHLFVPGWVHTGLTGARTKDKPDGAWTATQTAQYMLERVKEGKFYIICPDNETTPEMDKLRIMWGAEDVALGRPALSRWHPEYKALFEEYMRDNLTASSSLAP